MTAIWFGLAAACLVGAAVLLYIDRLRRARSGRVRQVWARSRNYSYKAIDPSLPQSWRRATLAKQGYLSAVDIVTGTRRGVRFTLFDLEDSATIVAVQRRIGSDIDVDMRLKTMPPPRDADLELLGAMGDRVVFANNVDVARRACDERMAALVEVLPANLHVVWSEGSWALGSLPVVATSKDWSQSIDCVIRFSGLLHVLPPVDEEDPGEDDRPVLPHRAPLSERDRSGNQESETEKPVDDEQAEIAAGVSAAVGDDPAAHAIGESEARRPGGPFHPGFRPYLGPLSPDER